MYFLCYTTDRAFRFKKTYVFKSSNSLILKWCCISLPLNLKSISRSGLALNFSQFALHQNEVLLPCFYFASWIFCQNIYEVVQMKFVLNIQLPDHQHQKYFLQIYRVIFVWKTYYLYNTLTMFNWRHQKLTGLWFCYCFLPFS